jgi:hypothetical protein
MFVATAAIFVLTIAAPAVRAASATEQDAHDVRIVLANGVEMPFINLGGIASSPSNYSAYLELGGRGATTPTRRCFSVGPADNPTRTPAHNSTHRFTPLLLLLPCRDHYS